MPQTTIADALAQLAQGITVTGNEPPASPLPPPREGVVGAAGGTYLFTSSSFEGAVVFEFDADGFLIRYDITEAQLSEAQKVFILQKLPKSIGAIEALLAKAKGSKLVAQKASAVTFQQFWDKYNEKARSSKKKAETTWKRLSQVQRDRAYNLIDTYFKSIPPGIAKKYAETYLNAELWNN